MTSEASHSEYKLYLHSTKNEKLQIILKHVILQNETLRTRVTKLQDDVKRLESFVEELEDDNGRMEKSNGYTRNL